MVSCGCMGCRCRCGCDFAWADRSTGRTGVILIRFVGVVIGRGSVLDGRGMHMGGVGI